MNPCKSAAPGRLITLLVVVLLVGCTGLGQVPPAPQRLDLGAPPEGGARTAQDVSVKTLVVPPVSAPAMLQGVGVVWRMGVDGLPNRYATYEWAASPDSLIHDRLIDRLSQSFAILPESVSSDDLTLRVNLLQFEQVYAEDGSGNEGVVGLQAVLLRGSEVLGQYRDTERVRAQANDAQAGARALRTATDQLANNMAGWISQTARK